jgi:hypothetical protein
MEMAQRKVVTPSHRSVLRRGIRTADDYLRLVQVLIWDVSNRLVPVEYAQRLIRFMMPDRLRSITLTKKQTGKLRRGAARGARNEVASTIGCGAARDVEGDGTRGRIGRR